MKSKTKKPIMKNPIVIISGIIILLIIGIVVYESLPASIRGVRGAADLTRIVYAESFDQAEDEYFVYFWNADCNACQQFDPDIVAAHERGVIIYVVDVADEQNRATWFQGEAGTNNQRPQNASEIEIAATPSLLHFRDGEVIGYALGIANGNALLDSFGQ